MRSFSPMRLIIARLLARQSRTPNKYLLPQNEKRFEPISPRTVKILEKTGLYSHFHLSFTRHLFLLGIPSNGQLSLSLDRFSRPNQAPPIRVQCRKGSTMNELGDGLGRHTDTHQLPDITFALQSSQAVTTSDLAVPPKINVQGRAA